MLNKTIKKSILLLIAIVLIIPINANGLAMTRGKVPSMLIAYKIINSADEATIADNLAQVKQSLASRAINSNKSITIYLDFDHAHYSVDQESSYARQDTEGLAAVQERSKQKNRKYKGLSSYNNKNQLPLSDKTKFTKVASQRVAIGYILNERANISDYDDIKVKKITNVDSLVFQINLVDQKIFKNQALKHKYRQLEKTKNLLISKNEIYNKYVQGASPDDLDKAESLQTDLEEIKKDIDKFLPPEEILVQRKHYRMKAFDHAINNRAFPSQFGGVIEIFNESNKVVTYMLPGVMRGSFVNYLLY